MKHLNYEKLLSSTRELLNKVGLDSHSAEAVTVGLCETSLRGVDSHGIRLLPHYVNSAESGRKNKNPQFGIHKKFPGIISLDADNAFGHAAGMKSIDLAMEVADELGVAVVGVSNSSHPGAMASFALRAARKGYLALAFTHADSLQLSFNGSRSYFGTNPVCFAAPRKNGEPFCLDMATTIIPWNKVLLSRKKNEQLPENVAADKDGNITTDPFEATSLLSAGAYKGFGLAAMVEILCSIFTGMKFGRDIPSMYKTPIDQKRSLGQFYLVFKADGCIDFEEFISNMQEMTDQVRSEPKAGNDKVMLAGDKEEFESFNRRKNGIPIDDSTYSEIAEVFEKYSINFEVVI